MTLHAPHNPLSVVAREAMEMGDKHGGKAFQTVAMVSMGVVALAAGAQVMVELLKALNHRDHGRHGQDDRGTSWQDREDERRNTGRFTERS